MSFVPVPQSSASAKWVVDTKNKEMANSVLIVISDYRANMEPGLNANGEDFADQKMNRCPYWSRFGISVLVRCVLKKIGRTHG